jgi:hypothetical protein
MSVKLRHDSYYYGLPVYAAETIYNTTIQSQTRYYCSNRAIDNKFTSTADSRTCSICNAITTYMLVATQNQNQYIICSTCAPTETFEKTQSAYR